jgi:hypothetical protein
MPIYFPQVPLPNPCSDWNASDAIFWVPASFTDAAFVSDGGSYFYKSTNTNVYHCDGHVVDVLMHRWSNNPNYPGPGPGLPVHVEANFVDLPSSNGPSFNVPEIERDCQSYVLEMWHRVRRNDMGGYTQVGYRRLLGHWNMNQTCSVSPDVDTLPQDWVVDKLDHTNTLPDRHRLMVRGQLRGTAQRVMIQLVGQVT